jgi:hypothetical protein
LEIQGSKVDKDSKVFKDHKVLKVLLEMLGHQELLVLLEYKGSKVVKVYKDHKVLKVLLVQQVQLV